MTKSGFFPAICPRHGVALLAMFGPGFITGAAIQRFGTLVVSIIGGVFFASACVAMTLGDNIYNYACGMILCGIGWNLSFSAGTVMLMSSYEPDEATYVQAFNGFCLIHHCWKHEHCIRIDLQRIWLARAGIRGISVCSAQYGIFCLRMEA